jgi:hypothetical protein
MRNGSSPRPKPLDEASQLRTSQVRAPSPSAAKLRPVTTASKLRLVEPVTASGIPIESGLPQHTSVVRHGGISTNSRNRSASSLIMGRLKNLWRPLRHMLSVGQWDLLFSSANNRRVALRRLFDRHLAPSMLRKQQAFCGRASGSSMSAQISAPKQFTQCDQVSSAVPLLSSRSRTIWICCDATSRSMDLVTACTLSPPQPAARALRPH